MQLHGVYRIRVFRGGILLAERHATNLLPTVGLNYLAWQYLLGGSPVALGAQKAIFPIIWKDPAPTISAASTGRDAWWYNTIYNMFTFAPAAVAGDGSIQITGTATTTIQNEAGYPLTKIGAIGIVAYAGSQCILLSAVALTPPVPAWAGDTVSITYTVTATGVNDAVGLDLLNVLYADNYQVGIARSWSWKLLSGGTACPGFWTSVLYPGPQGAVNWFFGPPNNGSQYTPDTLQALVAYGAGTPFLVDTITLSGVPAMQWPQTANGTAGLSLSSA